MKKKEESSFVVEDAQTQRDPAVLSPVGEAQPFDHTFADSSSVTLDQGVAGSIDDFDENSMTLDRGSLTGNAPDRAQASTQACTDIDRQRPVLGSRYEILDYIGAGGMGSVWKIRDKVLNDTLALKVLHKELLSDESAIKRFKKESVLASELTHANIAAIFGLGEDANGQPYIVMRYAEGLSLAAILEKEGKLAPERAEDIFNQVSEALQHAHMKGIIHRDIKPSNIIVCQTASGADLVQLVDFGIAKSIFEDSSSSKILTQTSSAIGSPLYMSPEQFLGQEVGPFSDYYSLGCVFYEMLCGRPPFSEKNIAKLILQHIGERPDFLAIPAKYQKVLHACLQKSPELRQTYLKDKPFSFARNLVVATERHVHLLVLLAVLPTIIIEMSLAQSNSLTTAMPAYLAPLANIPLCGLVIGMPMLQFALLTLRRLKTEAESELILDLQFASLLSLISSSTAVALYIFGGIGGTMLLHWAIIIPFLIGSFCLIYDGKLAARFEQLRCTMQTKASERRAKGNNKSDLLALSFLLLFSSIYLGFFTAMVYVLAKCRVTTFLFLSFIMPMSFSLLILNYPFELASNASAGVRTRNVFIRTLAVWVLAYLLSMPLANFLK